MGLPWISLWTFLSRTGRVPIPVPSCLQGCKMCFRTWETSVESYWNGLLHPSMLDSQTLALVSTRSRISVSCACRYTGTAGGYLICQEAACTSDIFWNDAALCLAGPLSFMATVTPQSTTDTTWTASVLPSLIKLHTWIFFKLASVLMSYPSTYNVLISLGGSYI